MQDKLKKRKLKIDWLMIIDSLKLSDEFRYWKRGKKIKSKQRLGYMFIKHIKGRNYISDLRRLKDWNNEYLSELIRIAHTPWQRDQFDDSDDGISWNELIKELSK